MTEDLEMQQYLFDLQGYLIVENAISPEKVKELNDIFDQQGLPDPGKSRRFGSAPDGAGFLEWGKPYCDLLDHPSIMPIMRFRLGECFRLDRLYGMYMGEGMGRGGLHADYGTLARHSSSKPGEYFHFPQHEITHGFMVVAWSLSDAGPGLGGFCCIPGSHKSHYRVPQAIRDAPEESPQVIIPEAPAGSVILFTESLTHGTYAWTGKHQRRSLLYKYCVAHTAWRPNRVSYPDSVELTDRQKVLFREPADPIVHFPSLFEGFDENGNAI